MYSDILLSLRELESIINIIPAYLHGKHKQILSPKGYQLLFKLMYHGMMNVSETITIKKQDIDPNDNKIILPKPEKSLDNIVRFSSKKIWREILEYIKDRNENDRLFPITRFTILEHFKGAAKSAGLQVTEFDRSTSLRYLRESRASHLRHAMIFTEIEVDQLMRINRDRKKLIGTPSSHEKLLKKEERVNMFLETFCEDCLFGNPIGANFCCVCGKSLTAGKSIL